MAKIRIHELAKEIAEKVEGLDSKTLTQDILKILQDAGSDVKNHMSTVADEEAEKIRARFTGGKKPAKAASTAAKKPEPAKKEHEKKEPEKKEPEKTEPEKEEKSSQPAQPAQSSQVRQHGVLRTKDGKEIHYRVAKDGRLINIESNSVLPFKMSSDGKSILRMDGSPITRKPVSSLPPKPMVQVFDGRSDKDRQRAANNAQRQNMGQKGGLTNAIGSKISNLASQLDPAASNTSYQEGPKKKKTEADYTLPTLPDDFKSGKQSGEAPANTQKVPEAQNNAQETQPAKEKSLVHPIVHGNIYDHMNAARQERPQGGRPQGGRPYGDRQQNGQGRPYGDRPQNGQGRPYGDRPQNGQGRPYGDRPQNGQGRPYGDRPQNGQGRPYGDRPQNGQGRPYGDRPQNGQGRPFGDRNQNGQGGFGGKDEPRRNFTNNRPGGKGPAGGNAKSELANDIGKNKRADSFKNRKDYDKRGKNDYEDGENKKNKKDPNRKGAFQKPVAKPQKEVEDEIKTIVIPEVITIKELADKMRQKAGDLVKKLFLAGKMVNLNSELSFEEAEEIALDYEIICEKEEKVNIIEELLKEAEEDEALLQKRPPVVCVMGHVDHGKTSLLDAIRKTNVTAREAGGITQHIGAYMVEIGGRKITFLDTPGHEAFTSMRMRGAQSTDIAILVVAADDGVMPQTIEAINHAKAAGVSIIIAINKMDKPGANIDRVKQELTEYELVSEDWGGDTVMVPVSAKTGEGIENLLEMVLLTADVLELKANPDRKARGVVIEAKLDKGRGPVATVLVQKGTLNVGDNVVIGSVHGKVRAMIDDKGRKVKDATPSTPVELLGLNGVPAAGEVMLSVADEKEARTIAEAFIAQSKEQLIAESKKNTTLESLFSQIHEGEIKNLNIIIKADVMGSVEAVKESLVKLSNDEVAVRVIHGGVGNINESDVNLAAASDAIVIGFNVKPDNTAKDIAEHENIDIKLYKVIYDAINDVEAAMKGMLKPIYQEKVIGHAEVRQLFKASGIGVIAGSFVLDGKITRGCSARITRGGEQIFEGALASLKRFKDDVKEVAAGYECGLVFEKFSDLAELDQAEFYVMEEVPRN